MFVKGNSRYWLQTAKPQGARVQVKWTIDVMSSLKDEVLQMVPPQLSGYVKPHDDNDSYSVRGQVFSTRL